MHSRIILLWLEAPLQSWGADSKFGRRDTLPFPTRSGVLGLLLCAMGASGEQAALLARMMPFGQTVVAYGRRRNQGGGPMSKADREPMLCDFQMVGSGYDERDKYETLMIPKTIEGKKAVGGGTKMTFRYYLQDAMFAVMLEAPEELAETFGAALQNPVFDLYLGRKSCVPTEFIYQGTYESEGAAEDRLAELIREKGVEEDFRVLEGDHEEGDAMTLNDVPVQFGPVKKYRDRRVTVVHR